jgi:flagellar motor switch/type III secretory pathway protein FliN
MRRFALMGWTLALMLGLFGTLRAQEEKKAEEPKQEPAKTEETTAPAATAEPAPATPAAPAELPEDVKVKLEAARKAVAELIAACEKANLVQTNVSPPPILDILVNGKATDKTELAVAVSKPDQHVGLLSPEAFGAYFPGYAAADGINAGTNVRIRQPSQGLKEFYDRRAAVFNPYLEEARKALGITAPSAAPAEPAKAEEPKPEAKPEEPKPEEPKAEEPKPEKSKPDTPKPEEPKPDTPKPEEPKPNQSR